jgi:phage repressor protein C with HTH and peptisase S24 domain
VRILLRGNRQRRRPRRKAIRRRHGTRWRVVSLNSEYQGSLFTA